MLADDIGKPFSPTRKFGYSCQTILSKRVNEFLHPGTYYCWYSLGLNPAAGGNSSNPLWLYQTLSHAVRTKDVNDTKLRQIRTSLLDAVTSGFPISGNPEAAKCIVQVSHADVELYRPQLWRVNLASVSTRAVAGHQYPDEREVEDLQWSEFEIVVE